MFKTRLLSGIVLMIFMLFFVISGGNILLSAIAFSNSGNDGIYANGKTS